MTSASQLTEDINKPHHEQQCQWREEMRVQSELRFFKWILDPPQGRAFMSTEPRFPAVSAVFTDTSPSVT